MKIGKINFNEASIIFDDMAQNDKGVLVSKNSKTPNSFRNT
jgi:hypothetical protein